MCNFCPVARACQRGPLPEVASDGTPAAESVDPTTAGALALDALLVGTMPVGATAVVTPEPLRLGAARNNGPAPVRVALPVVSTTVPDDAVAEPEPVAEPADLDEWDPAERGELVAAG